MNASRRAQLFEKYGKWIIGSQALSIGLLLSYQHIPHLIRPFSLTVAFIAEIVTIFVAFKLTT